MRRFIIPLSLVLLGLLVSCTSCTEQSINNKPEGPLRLLWSFAFTQPVDGLSAVTLRPEMINSSVIVGLDRQFTSLSQDDGTFQWQRKIPDEQLNFVNILNHDESYLYGKNHNSETYFAISLQSGALAWKKQNTHGKFYQYPRDGNNKDHIFLSGVEPKVYVFSKTGEYETTIDLQQRARGINAINNNIFVKQGWKPDSTENAYGRIISLNAETHQQNWKYETTQGGFYYSELVLKDGVLYSGTTSGPSVFVALDAVNGQVKWEREGLLTFRFTMGDSQIFINDGQFIVALDQETGEERWRQDFTYATTSNVAYLDGYVYHAHNGGLYVLDAQNGQLAAGPILAPDGSGFYNLNAVSGRVFVQSDLHLYAYEAYNTK